MAQESPVTTTPDSTKALQTRMQRNTLQNNKSGRQTHSVVESRQVFIVVLLQPVVEVLGVVGGVALAVGGHAEDGEGVLDLREAGQLRLKRPKC